MALKAEEIENFIREALPDAKITISDLAGDGNHYAAEIISAHFVGLSKLQQHRLVYDSLNGNMGDVLHALALTTKTP